MLHSYSYQHTNCPLKGAAQGVIGLFGCSARAWGWGRATCGAVLERSESDYVSSVHISEQSLNYPRVLVAETQINGKTTAALTCADSLDCHEKCQRMEKTARAGGLAAPESCAMCKPPCPQDFITSLSDFSAAFLHDMELVFRLGAACFGPSGGGANCFCNILVLVKPVWLAAATGPDQQCRGGDVFLLIVARISLMILDYVEMMLNRYIINPINGVICGITFGGECNALPQVCLSVLFDKTRCKDGFLGQEALIAMLGCSWLDSTPAYERCYFARQRAICFGEDNEREKYKSLFHAPSEDELEQQFQAIAGSSFESVPPIMGEAFKQVSNAKFNKATSLPNYNPEAEGMCDPDQLKSAMGLEEIILACVFNQLCYEPDGEEAFETDLRDMSFDLPDVVWDWTGSPPPPPPFTTAGPYRELLDADPEGFELTREAVLDCWPRLQYAASQASGSNVGRGRSSDGLGYGPLYYVSRYSMSTAFLATNHYEDQDSLAARIVQARFTGMFRFSCKCFMDFMSDPSNAAAGGTNVGDGNKFAGVDATESVNINPGEFASRYDRNHLLYAALLYKESLAAETGENFEMSLHGFWQENCIDPLLDRSAVPTATWQTDFNIYGNIDSFEHEVPAADIGPLRTYGSLRQVRDTLTWGSGAPEDFVEHTEILRNELRKDRELRTERSIQRIYEERVCNPADAYSIEDAVGDPETREGTEIRDSSAMINMVADMYVPNAFLKGNFDKTRSSGCSIHNDCGDTGYSYMQSSLRSWIYITSSHDNEVSPGWHRLLHLKAWTMRSCNQNPNQVCKMRSANHLGFAVSSLQGFEREVSAARSAEATGHVGLSFSSNAYTNTFAVSGTSAGLGGGRRLQINDDALPNYEDRRTEHTGNVWNDIITGVPIGLLNNERVTIYVNMLAGRTQDTTFRSGLDALRETRCSTELRRLMGPAGGFRFCQDQGQYATMTKGYCHYQDLELVDQQRVHDAAYYKNLFLTPGPPPKPPPNPPPPFPPLPPDPSPPPSPPAAISADHARQLVHIMQRDFCDSVSARNLNPNYPCLGTDLSVCVVRRCTFSALKRGAQSSP